MMYTKALVTGGAGFIGSHLVDALVDQGVAVTVLDLVDAPADRRNDRTTYIQGDIRDKNLGVLMQSVRPEIVFHLAAQIDNRSSDPVLNAEHNELGSVNVFEQARLAGASKIVFTSSCAVYGLPDTLPVTETMTPRPRTAYGISKWAAEHYLDAMSLQYDISTVALRFGNVYGPRQDSSREGGVAAVFTAKLLAGVAPFLNDDGLTALDYVFVDDIVQALMLAGQGSVSGVFNVGTGREVMTKDLFTMIQKSVGTTIGFTPRPEVRDAVKRMALDATLIREAFGWVPTVNLEEGIAKTVEWYRSRK